MPLPRTIPFVLSTLVLLLAACSDDEVADGPADAGSDRQRVLPDAVDDSDEGPVADATANAVEDGALDGLDGLGVDSASDVSDDSVDQTAADADDEADDEKDSESGADADIDTHQGVGDAPDAGTNCVGSVDTGDPYYARFEGIGFDNGCDTSSDCVVGGCSGEICAAEASSSTCEVLPYGPDGDCGCVDGTCLWNTCEP